MYSIATGGDIAVVSCNTKIIAFRLDRVENQLLQLPEERNLQDKPVSKSASTHQGSTNGTDEPASNSIVCLTFSSCGKWLAACSSGKHLYVWGTTDWDLVSDRAMPRAASSVVFTPNASHIIVADKSGDAFLFSATNWTEEGTLLLGHLSMLLDVVTSADGKYVLTCDRDEKIRVSHFPNAYNIVSYCLGHEEFVTSMALLPHDVSILVSCSGDGTICLWNYMNGSLCKTYSCSADVVANLTKLEKREGSQSDASDNIPLKRVCCSKLDTSTSVACIIPDSYKGTLLYSITSADSNFNNISVNVSLLQIITSNVEPSEISFSTTGVLFILTPDDEKAVETFCFDEESGLFTVEKCNQNLLQSVVAVNKQNNFFVLNPVNTSTISQLFKRKFDNLQDYHERKKARVTSNTSSAAL